jgi:hypothetical protein
MQHPCPQGHLVSPCQEAPNRLVDMVVRRPVGHQPRAVAGAGSMAVGSIAAVPCSAMGSATPILSPRITARSIPTATILLPVVITRIDKSGSMALMLEGGSPSVFVFTSPTGERITAAWDTEQDHSGERPADPDQSFCCMIGKQSKRRCGCR